MKKLIILLFASFSITTAFSQNVFKAFIKDSETNEPLTGATAYVSGTANGSAADINGLVEIKNIPDGNQVIVFSFVGYKQRSDTIKFPLTTSEIREIFMESEAEEMEEVIISSTRSTRTIENIPTRAELIAGEELEEKGNMKPGDIRMMLNESTGIQTQQTSATSYNSSIRIQGLDGKYTQILKDGIPLYSGFSGGLSLLQIVPLDLKQVEVIKGATSTLYGGGAIAGLVNLISKTPAEKKELSFLFNGTSASGLDASGFYSQRFKKIGATVFASYNLGTPYDPANLGLTAIPKFNRYTINPKLFFYLNDKTTLNIGFNKTVEDRVGGDIKYIEGKGDSIHSYFEKNQTNRFSTQLEFDRKVNDKSKFVFKNSISYYDRAIEIPNFIFSGVQLSSFSEGNYHHKGERMEWIAGANLWTDKFTQNKIDTAKAVDYNYTTLGVFVQNTWSVTEKFILETGFRGDFQNEYGFFALPRISALVKVNQQLTARIGGGLGYKTPTVFTEDAERIQFRNVLPINVSKTRAEKSFGGNFDINYKTPVSDKIFMTINTLVFYTQVKNPLILEPAMTGLYEFQQPEGFIDTKGIETNIKLTFNNYKLFIGYTLADVNQHYNGGTSAFPLVAQHRLNNVLMYEIEDKLKIGLEAYYFSPQKLNDGATGKDYWMCGMMVEKLWDHFSIFLNFENITDTRQTKFDTIFTGTITNPIFRDIYAPVDGFVINGGLKLKLW
jgi:outer membrane receptor for ferrienterochelin and colicins